MANGTSPESGAEHAPEIHYFGAVTSTFDEASRLYEEGRLPVWDSVIAREQSAGRGQLRRHWISPPGNLYWTLRLPHERPFDTTAAPVALGALLVQALCGLGCQALLKWPNDVVVRQNRNVAKVAGILVEERGDCLLAGIGVNLASSPELAQMGSGEAMVATSLSKCLPACDLPSPAILGQRLARHLILACKDMSEFAGKWRELADSSLLWLGQEVILRDKDEEFSGIFLGLGDGACAQIEKDGNVREFFGGTMREKASNSRQGY